MRVLITGGAGFIGSNLARTLVNLANANGGDSTALRLGIDLIMPHGASRRR